MSLWRHVGSFFGLRMAEHPACETIIHENQCELRRYAQQTRVWTEVDASHIHDNHATGVAFRRLYDYIAGSNESRFIIDMTAPVLQCEQDGHFEMVFFLPRNLHAAIAPRPLNMTVHIDDVPIHYTAIIRYKGRSDQTEYAKHLDILTRWIESRGWQKESGPALAQYDPPFTLPPLRRNEIWIKVSQNGL